jgi:hypothetical protein
MAALVGFDDDDDTLDDEQGPTKPSPAASSSLR